MAYIKLEDVLEVLNKRNMTKNIAINEIKNIPTADVVEVKHGEWIIETREIGVELCYRGICSVCGRTVAGRKTKDILELPYCHCGAKMDGGKADNE